MSLPDLSSLASPSLAATGVQTNASDIGVDVPQTVISEQKKRGRIPQGGRGVIVSAGASKKGSLRELALQIKPTQELWLSGGWLYAYYETDEVNGMLVVQLQKRNLAFTFLGGVKVKPSAFVVALIVEYWGKKGQIGQTGNGSVLDRYYNDKNGSYTRGLFMKILNDTKHMGHWRDKFKDINAVMEDVRAGKTLPIMWEDDGMWFIQKHLVGK
jgi:hypothetical protein